MPRNNRRGVKALDDFVDCYRPGQDRSERRDRTVQGDPHDKLIARDKANLDITWLRDESLEDKDNLPAPDMIAPRDRPREIVEDLTAALAEFAQRSRPGIPPGHRGVTGSCDNGLTAEGTLPREAKELPMKQSTPHSDFRRGRRNRAFPATAAALASVAVLSVGIGAAAATPSHWEPYHFEYGPVATEDFCGVPGVTVEQQGVVEGRIRTTTHGPDDLSYDHDHGSFTDTWTNVETGEFVTVVGSYINDAHRVTDNGDGTLTILFQGPSRRERLNEDGERISLSAGLTAFELLIDHAGTPTDPSDDVFLEFLGFVKDVGLTPDFCTTVVQAIG